MRKAKRTTKLIANFVDEYAEGWHFAVGQCFRDELDIKFTKRVIKGNHTRIWTQGPFYCFAVGHVMFEYPPPWIEKSDPSKLVCQVSAGTPNRLDNDGNFVDGHIAFDLFHHNVGGNRIGRHYLTQNEFVEFLKTGKMSDGNSNDKGKKQRERTTQGLFHFE